MLPSVHVWNTLLNGCVSIFRIVSFFPQGEAERWRESIAGAKRGPGSLCWDTCMHGEMICFRTFYTWSLNHIQRLLLSRVHLKVPSFANLFILLCIQFICLN